MSVIAFLNTAIPWGGGEKWHFEVAQYMHSKGHKVLIIAHDKSELKKKAVHSKIPHLSIKVNNRSFLNPFKKRAFGKILQQHEVSTLIINLSSDLKFAAPVAHKTGVQKVIYRRGSAIPITDNQLNRLIFKNYLTHVLANSEATKATILENNPELFPASKIEVIYNGLDVGKKRTNIPKWKPEEPLQLVNLGRLEQQKNQLFLIEVANQLKNENLNFHLTIGGEGRLRPQLEKAIKENQLEQYVTLSGFVHHPFEFLSVGHVFLLSSLWEGFGYVIAEAALAGLPCIAFDLSSNKELIQNGVSGFLTQPENQVDFAKAIKHYYNDPDEVLEMGQKAQTIAITRFNREKVFKAIEEYLVFEKNEKISALLITYNEENNIREVINNLSFCDEIIVVDSFSTDGTINIIKTEFPNVKLVCNEFKNYTQQKQFALNLAQHNWVLFIDADERITKELEEEIQKTVNSANPKSAYYFKREFMFEGKKLNFSGSQTDKNFRLFQKELCHFDPNRIVHETLLFKGNAGILKKELIHFSYKDYKDYKYKMIKYGKMKAVEALKADKSHTWLHLSLNPIYRFLNLFLLRLGILDGKKGIIICYLNALGVYARYREMRRLKRLE